MITAARFNDSSPLRDCEDLQYILLGDLRDLLEEAPTKQSKRWLLAVLEALLATLPQEQTLKSQDGYLSEVLEEYPNWAHKVNRLETEQLALHEHLRQLREQLQTESSYRRIAKRLQRALAEWMTAFVSHQRNESDLLLKAMTLEVGSGD